jgi:tetratricopeptide (TPR) repeat protein
MASLIEGYEYDIFISYRQKDNKGDKWVSKFVESLKTELESTFKEDVSVYFDENPHDRLQETHNVDKSLEGKLKCIIFIPILSQTYCDPSSYAWQHEFLAFLRVAESDHFGRDVKLRSGNVTSRILPIRIHDLEQEDIKLYEKEAGSVLRAMDFVFKTSAGVIRPLLPNEDHPNDNLNKTYYRDQISKVSLAIKDIILGMKAGRTHASKEKTFTDVPPAETKIDEKTEAPKISRKFSENKLLLAIAVVALLIFVGIVLYPKIFKRDLLDNLRSSDGRISVEVMPFENMTSDSSVSNWQNWIRDNLITALSNSEGLKLGNKDASIIIYGSYIKVGSKIRFNAKLIDSQTEELVKSFQKDGTADNLLPLIDTLSRAIKDFLEISKLKKEGPFNLWNMLSATSSPESYRYYTAAKKAFEKRDYPTVRNMLTQALAIDSNFYYAKILLIYSYANVGIYDKAKELTLKLYGKKDQMSIPQKIYTEYMYSNLFETPYEVIKHLKRLEEIDNQVPNIFDLYGYQYNELQQYDKAIYALEHAQEIYDRWGSKPWWVINYSSLGFAYHKIGNYKKEKEIYIRAQQEFPDDPAIIYRQAILSFTEGDTVVANRFIQKYIDVSKENSRSDASIKSDLADIYAEAGIPDKADKYYRQALLIWPDNPYYLNNLAHFLIETDRNLNEGLELVERALKLSPDSWYLLNTKGWGLYKQGKYQNAYELLNKAWNLKPVYEHELYLHLEEAKKAFAQLR